MYVHVAVVNACVCCVHGRDVCVCVLCLCMLLTGIWHKKYFSNRDIVEILRELDKENFVGNPRDQFFTIVTSACATTATPYRLFEKANTMATSLRAPRKSRLRGKNNNTDDDVTRRAMMLNRRFNVPNTKARRTALQTISAVNGATAGLTKTNKMLCKPSSHRK